MASLKKELKGVIERFDAAQAAFLADADKAKKHKKKLKKAKSKIKGLKQQVASLEQELKVAREETEAANAKAEAAGNTPRAKRSTKAAKSTSNKANESVETTEATQAEMAEAVSDAPDTVSEAAAEKTTTPKPRRGRPRKSATTTAKRGRSTKSAGTKTKSTEKTKTTRRRGRPSTKPAPSVLTQISGVGATMAKRFEEAGVTTVNQFSKLSDSKMKEVLEQCGPRYRNADSEKMEQYRENARAAMAS